MKVCFFALNAFPTLAATREARVGGAEVQQRLLARYLVGQAHQVTFVTRDHGQPDVQRVDGVTVHKAFRQGAGMPYLRYFHPRVTGCWAALRRADADVYYQRCAGMETGLLAAFCKWHRKPFVFAAASDTDFIPGQVIAASQRDRLIYLYGIRHADAIIAQTYRQQRLLQQHFGRTSVVIPNCWEALPMTAGDAGSERKNVLWVSTFRAWKHPERVPELAAKIPGLRFVMLGGPANGEQALYEQVERRSSQLSNVEFHGFVPFSSVAEYFDGARVVLNTSDPKEGFPNTFLQAWQRGVPVVTYFDPDGIVERERLGFVVSSQEGMINALGKLEDESVFRDFAARVKNYFETHHLIDTIGPRYEELFGQLV